MGFDPAYGARPLKRIIQKHIENPLSMEILGGKIKEGDKISVDVRKDQIVFNRL
jgi:ATP-dependent Clp protease ATP-binding subunit ClpA